VWLGLVLAVDHGRWQHSIWNIVVDLMILFVVLPGVAAIQRTTERESYRRVSPRLERDWPIAFWAAFVSVGVGLLATGFVGAGVAVLVIPALVFMWAGVRKITADPWK
jgi:hypothetical protein